MKKIIKSSNTQGNPNHVPAGSPEGGQFTSADKGAEQGSLKTRGHLVNPVYKKMCDFYENSSYSRDPDAYESALDEITQEYLEASLPIIMEDTGYDEAQARELLNAFTDYFGADYAEFSAGLRQDMVKIIDEGIKRMPKFKGTILRGASFNPSVSKKQSRFEKLMSKLKIGAEITLRNTPTSWTSNAETAKNFSKMNYPRYNSICFVCSNNKSGASVQHISTFGEEESEVLVPSNTRYKVLNIMSKNKQTKFFDPETKDIIVFLEEI